MRKPAFCICENKDADQLRSQLRSKCAVYCAADQRLCFRYIDSTIPLLPIYEITSLSHLLRLHSPVCVGPGQKPRGSFGVMVTKEVQRVHVWSNFQLFLSNIKTDIQIGKPSVIFYLWQNYEYMQQDLTIKCFICKLSFLHP